MVIMGSTFQRLPLSPHGEAVRESAAQSGLKLRDMDPDSRPQERLDRLGAEALSDIELIAMLLRSGSQQQDVLELSNSLLTQAGSLARLVHWTKEDFMAVKGIGKIKALQLKAHMEFAKRVILAQVEEPRIFDKPDKVWRYLQPIATELEIEKFWMIALNRKNHLIRISELTSGTASASLIHPREAYREAIRLGASAVIFAHNHPSGDPAPSSADIRVTHQLRDASRILDIDLLDHVIIGQIRKDPKGLGFFSFSESGLI